jgi:hypothetical protein
MSRLPVFAVMPGFAASRSDRCTCVLYFAFEEQTAGMAALAAEAPSK